MGERFSIHAPMPWRMQFNYSTGGMVIEGPEIPQLSQAEALEFGLRWRTVGQRIKIWKVKP